MTMNSERVEGTAKKGMGVLEEKIGDLVGDAKTQASGQARQIVGGLEATVGQVIDEVRDFTAEKPVAALLAAGGIGLILGMLMARR
jgi:uncharacterized protein YjbJ (UPF0337 family)